MENIAVSEVELPARLRTGLFALRWWLGLLCVLFATSILAQKAGPKSSKPNSNQSNPASKEQSVEAIAETARQSVVVISHFGRDGKEDGLGAGFVVSSNGLIATSLHVIGEARPISVQLANGTRYEASEVHAWDRKLDLAVIRIPAEKLASLPLGDSDTLKQGTPVVAMGNPLGLERSIVQGLVSAKRDFDGVEMIQLAIPVEPGNSGGPLLDMQGRVHGLLTLKSAVTPNLGFAMPVNALKSLLAKPNPVPMSRWLSLVTLNPREWTPVFGARWTQKGGRILVDTPGVGFGGRSLCLSAKLVPPRPFEIGVTVRLEDESGAAGLVFASDGGDKHYGFYPSAGQLRLTRFDGPVVDNWTILQQVASAHYHPGEWNMLKLRVEEGKILCHVNGHLVIESTDNALRGGKVGLAKFRDTKAAFRNFEVGTNLAPALNPSVGEIAAVTEEVEKLGAAPDPAALAKLQEHRELAQSIMTDRAGKLEQQAAQLRRLAVTLHRQSVQDDLVKLFNAPEEQIDLFRAALLVSKLDNADLDVEAYRAQLDGMGRELASRLPAKAGEAAKLAALTNYLFAENGFHGSRTDFHNRANSYINEVLDDREGLPITLSVLFLELARRIELDNVAGVSLPGHFVVGYAPRNGGQQLLDIFENGKNLTRTEANELVVSFTGSPLTDEQLKPAKKRDIIIRMLQNLLRLAQRQESTADSLRYLDVIVALAPEAPLERYSRALLRLRAGDPAGAKEDFKWLLDNQPSEIDVDQLMQLYRTL